MIPDDPTPFSRYFFAATFTLQYTPSLNEPPCVGDKFSPWGRERVTNCFIYCGQIISVPSSYSAGGTSCDAFSFGDSESSASSFGEKKERHKAVSIVVGHGKGDDDAITPFIRRYQRGQSWQWSGDIGCRRFGLDCILQERAFLAVILVSAKTEQ